MRYGRTDGEHSSKNSILSFLPSPTKSRLIFHDVLLYPCWLSHPSILRRTMRPPRQEITLTCSGQVKHIVRSTTSVRRCRGTFHAHPWIGSPSLSMQAIWIFSFHLWVVWWKVGHDRQIAGYISTVREALLGLWRVWEDKRRERKPSLHDRYLHERCPL